MPITFDWLSQHFRDIDEFRRFHTFIVIETKSGRAEEVPVDRGSALAPDGDEYWFRHLASGRLFGLVARHETYWFTEIRPLKKKKQNGGDDGGGKVNLGFW